MMLWTTMPEAPIKEDGDLRSSKDNIRSTANLADGPKADPITQSKRVYCGTEREFRFSVSPSVPLHYRTDGLR